MDRGVLQYLKFNFLSYQCTSQDRSVKDDTIDEELDETMWTCPCSTEAVSNMPVVKLRLYNNMKGDTSI